LPTQVSLSQSSSPPLARAPSVHRFVQLEMEGQDGGEELLVHEEEAPVPLRSWLVLISFVFHSFANAFQWMDYTSVSTTAKFALGDGGMAPGDALESDQFNWLYSSGIICAAVSMLFCMRFMDKYHFGVLAFGAVVNVLGAWLRYLSVVRTNYTLALVSSIFVGIDCGILYSYFTAIADRWFPERLRTMAVTVCCQANYGGWGIAAVLVPSVVESREDLKSFLLIQAIGVSISLVVFFLCHRDHPETSDGDEPEVARRTSALVGPEKMRSTARSTSGISGASSASRASKDPELAKMQDPVKELWQILTNPSFLSQALCYGFLQGAGIAVPGIQDEIFSDLDYSSSDSRWTDFAFIFTGVIGGLILSAVVPQDIRKHGIILRAIFIVTALAAVGLVLLSEDSIGGKLSKDNRYACFVVAMPIFGFGAIGFVGIALPLICALVHPVSESISGAFVEFLGQVFAAFMAQVVSKFWVVAGVVLTVAIAFQFVFKLPHEEVEEAE